MTTSYQIRAHKPYEVTIGEGVSSTLPAILSGMTPAPSTVVVITDEHVNPLYGQSLYEPCAQVFPMKRLVLPAGEQTKSFSTFENILTTLLEWQLDRQCVLVALGGGVVGDVTGFVAASFLRGVRFLQVPTTLLAHDSAVGGKTGINHSQGKNLIGAFYHPEHVLYDVSFLDTLPERELRSGFAELVKEGLIGDKELYGELRTVTSLREVTKEQWTRWIVRGIAVKERIVHEDEREQGVRAVLNFGHTLGHALEKEAGYGVLTHGEAVFIGMVTALRMSQEHYSFDFPIAEFCQWAEELGYETSIPSSLSIDQLLSAMKLDKKADRGVIRYCLLEKVGRPHVVSVEDAFIRRFLELSL
ncbi:3-dehydroquinate synthase [Bacillus fonticola]|uniref:3-dehydroquinate synthase n=1 Tax=Bacillus fonticola TaxID=2728853 RepID=UPI001474DDE4|nr:3-dehydroquinate synthase [Bacillus fonticola]